ncbi:MAG: hypothetical protein LV479_09890 [Methylacidiphilales bacterium]|nr:hypothetical protein [Candidatus Methylacidiphilales bacterium]
MNRNLLLFLVLGLVTLSSRAFAGGLTENEIIKLPSGHTVKILSVSKIEYSKGIMALMVRYQTSLSVDETKALNQEVDELWKIAVKEVEHDGYDEAIISSNEVPKGIFLTANRMQNFLYEKSADGKWTRLNRSDFMAAQ